MEQTKEMDGYIMSIRIGPLDVAETKTVQFKFEGELSSSEIMIGATVDVTLLRGTDLTPQNIRVGSPVIDNVKKIVEQRVTAPGLAGNMYLLRCVATGDGAGNVHTVVAELPVVSLR